MKTSTITTLIPLLFLPISATKLQVDLYKLVGPACPLNGEVSITVATDLSTIQLEYALPALSTNNFPTAGTQSACDIVLDLHFDTNKTQNMHVTASELQGVADLGEGDVASIRQHVAWKHMMGLDVFEDISLNGPLSGVFAKDLALKKVTTGSPCEGANAATFIDDAVYGYHLHVYNVISVQQAQTVSRRLSGGDSGKAAAKWVQTLRLVWGEGACSPDCVDRLGWGDENTCEYRQ